MLRLGETPREERSMEIEDFERNLSKAGWVRKPEDVLNPRDQPLAKTKETSRKMDANLNRRIERRGESLKQVLDKKGIQGKSETRTR